MLLVLGLVGVISGLLLSYTYKYASPQIEENRQQKLEEAIAAVLGQPSRYERLDIEGEQVYQGFDRKGKPLGYAVMAQGNGYAGKIVLMFGVNPEVNRVLGMRVIESIETPGLGGRIRSDGFQAQFEDLKLNPYIDLVKGRAPQGPGQVQAITGATISSTAVVLIVNKKLDKLRDFLRDKGDVQE
jgi:electron transport complex protein RnfG